MILIYWDATIWSCSLFWVYSFLCFHSTYSSNKHGPMLYLVGSFAIFNKCIHTHMMNCCHSHPNHPQPFYKSQVDCSIDPYWLLWLDFHPLQTEWTTWSWYSHSPTINPIIPRQSFYVRIRPSRWNVPPLTTYLGFHTLLKMGLGIWKAIWIQLLK
jgi:hypothetical protein